MDYPIWKDVNFSTFSASLFIAKTGVFSFYNIVKDILLAYISIKKEEKWPFLDLKHGFTPLKKTQFFDILNFLFL